MMNTKFFENVKTMQEINNEYDSMIKYFEKYGSKTEKEAATAEAKIPDEFKNIIAQLLKYPKLHIEVEPIHGNRNSRN